MAKWEHVLSVKAGEEKVEIPISAELEGLTMDHFINRGLKDFAANLAKVVRDGDKSPAEFQAMFQESVEKYSRGETARREGGGAARIDTDESLAIRFLMKVLRKAQEGGTLAQVKVPVPGADSPPKTEKGAINYNAWAKQVKAAEHPWYAVAYKKVTAAEKGFE